MSLFLIRYGEIALKSPRVRSRFEKSLASSIKSRFATAGKECRVELERGRIFLWADDEEFTEWVLARTFGVVSFSKVIETSSKQQDIFALAAEMSKPLFKKGTRFCVRARRNGEHPYTSMELARDTGSAVFLANESMSPKVDLTHPELEIFVDVRQNRAYIYTGSTPGPGGMPLGTQGRVLGLVEERKDIAACWLMMKRGCRVIVTARNPDLTKPLEAWDPELKGHLMDGSESLVGIARRRRTEGLCVGWTVEGFDERITELAELDIPVFYPLMGMSKGEIDAMLAMIDG
jgi:thiamine biosynthesis protein ThiI